MYIFWGKIIWEYFYSYFSSSYQVILSCFCFHSFLDFYFNLTSKNIMVNIAKLSTRKVRAKKAAQVNIFRPRTLHASILLQVLHFQPKTEWINTVMKQIYFKEAINMQPCNNF